MIFFIERTENAKYKATWVEKHKRDYICFIRRIN